MGNLMLNGISYSGGGDIDALLPIDTASGSVANFNTSIAKNLVSCVAQITAVQSGTGDPAPDNVRPISGFDGLELSHSGADTSNPDIITVDWTDEAGTVYGGELDLLSGVLTVTYVIFDISELTFNYSSTYQRFQSTTAISGIKAPTNNNTKVNALCSHFAIDTSNNTAESGKDNIIGVSMTGVVQIRDISLNGDTTLLATLLNDCDFIYELATPITYQLTPQEIETLIGVNNIWADTGDIAVSFKCTPQDYVDSKLSALNANNRSLAKNVSEEPEEEKKEEEEVKNEK